MSGGGGRGFGRGGASNRGGGKKRTASNEGGAPARKAPKCGLCGVEGKRIYFDTKKKYQHSEKTLTSSDIIMSDMQTIN